jgi:hypothetical protein
MTQNSVNWLVKYPLKYVRNFFITYWIKKKTLEMRSPMCTTKLTRVWHRYSNWLADLTLSIPVNTRECVRLIDFWGTQYLNGNLHLVLPSSDFSILVSLNSKYLNMNLFVYYMGRLHRCLQYLIYNSLSRNHLLSVHPLCGFTILLNH